MKKVKVSAVQLRLFLGAVLRDVRRGQTFIITWKGTPIAEIRKVSKRVRK